MSNGNSTSVGKKRVAKMVYYFIETPLANIEETFIEYTKRKDIAIILINQHVRS